MKGLILQRGSLSSEKYVISRSVFNRVLEPVLFIADTNKAKLEIDVMKVSEVLLSKERISKYDFAIFCKHNTSESVELHKRLKENGVKVYYDFDDLIYKFTEDSIAFEHMNKVSFIKFHLENSDMVVFSNKEISEIACEDFTIKDSVIIKTGINTEKYSNSKYDPNINGVIYTNGDIIKLEKFRTQFYNVFNNFLEANKSCLFDVFGDTESYLKYFSRYNFLGSLPWDEHKNYLSSNQYSMAVVPLGGMEESAVHQEFSICKTPIKFFEYGAMSIPTIFSKSKIYTDVVEHNVTGLIVENNEVEWEEALNTLYHDYELRKRIAKNAFEKVRESHDIKLASKEWLSILEN